WPTVQPAACLQSFGYAMLTPSAPSSSTEPARRDTDDSPHKLSGDAATPIGCATGAAVRSTIVIDFHARSPSDLPGVIVRIGDIAPETAMLRNIGCSEDCSARGDQFLHHHFDALVDTPL